MACLSSGAIQAGLITIFNVLKSKLILSRVHKLGD